MSETGGDQWAVTIPSDDWDIGDLVTAEVGGQTYHGIIIRLYRACALVSLGNRLETVADKTAMRHIRHDLGPPMNVNFKGLFWWHSDPIPGDSGEPSGACSSPAPPES